MVVSFRIPTLSSTLVTNLLGLVGLLAVVVAVGALTAWPWALLTAGVFAVSMSALAQRATPAAASELDAARSRRVA